MRSASWLVIAALLGVSIGSALTFWWGLSDAPPEVTPPPAVTAVPVVIESYDGTRPATATVGLAPAETLEAPTDGRITASSCEPGRRLASGEPLVSVDGQPIVALATEVPMWRDLSRGTKGADVQALQSELERLGFELTVTGSFDSETQAAVRAFNSAVGRGEATDIPVNSLIWLPSPSWDIETCETRVGDYVTATSVLAAGPLAIDTFQLEAELPDALLGRSWTFRAFGKAIDLDADLQPSDERATQTVSDVIEASGSADSTATLDGTTSLTEPIEVVIVPPAAVIIGSEGGSSCLRLAESGETIEVAVVDSALGRTMLIPSVPIKEGTSVAIRGAGTC
ncbi:MAG TPA: peptidoglycan-binding domain-containing protein [Acidimicrobiia bacterium]